MTPGVSTAEEFVEQSESPAHRTPQFSLDECVCMSVPTDADFVIVDRKAYGSAPKNFSERRAKT
jgi:hypothetical protein